MRKRVWKVIGSLVGSIILLGLVGWLILWGYHHINWTKADPWIHKAIELYKKGGNVYFGTFFLIFIGYLIQAVRDFRKDPEKFSDDIWKIRKTFYVLYLILTGLGIIAGYIDFRDWKILTQLTAFVVFVDLAVFQTPSITKIWSAEFQHRGKIEKAIEGNVEFINSTTTKIKILSEVINQTEEYFAPITHVPQQWRSFQQELKTYLNLYTSKFRFKVDLFSFRVDENGDEDRTREHISTALKNIETLHSHKIDDTPGKDNEPSYKTQVVEKLLNGESPILEQGKLIVIPIYHPRSLLLTIKAGDTAKVDEIDVSHIVNLIRIFSWYM